MKKLPKGWKITTTISKQDKRFFEARLWFDGLYRATVPTLFETKEKARFGALGWFEECNKKS
jgi:hypothetical protein